MSRTLIILLVLPMAVFNQQSCLVPSELSQPLNFIAENRVLLLTEGRCFLGCFTHGHPSFAVSIYTLTSSISSNATVNILTIKFSASKDNRSYHI